MFLSSLSFYLPQHTHTHTLTTPQHVYSLHYTAAIWDWSNPHQAHSRHMPRTVTQQLRKHARDSPKSHLDIDEIHLLSLRNILGTCSDPHYYFIEFFPWMCFCAPQVILAQTFWNPKHLTNNTALLRGKKPPSDHWITFFWQYSIFIYLFISFYF
jgi:hypothetical protein